MPLPNHTRRRLLQATAAAAALPTSLVHAQGTRTLKVVSPWEVMTLDPSKTGYIFTRLEVAETLVEVDDKGLFVGGLASRWSTSADGLEWRFTLRPTARFHDGTPVTAEAVAACLQRALAQPGLLRSTGAQQIAAQGGEVLFRLAKPFSALPAFLAHNSTLILAPASYAADGSVRQVIGSGPYQVVEVHAPQSLRTRRFEGFDGRKPVIEAVDYLGASRGETRSMMASSGQADLVYTHDPVSYERLRASRKLQLHRLPLPRTIYIKVNAGHRFLADLRVRRALSLALDRTGMATALLRAPEAAATQLFPPAVAEWYVPGLAPLAQNVEQSRALLREAGWQPGGDGLLRNKAGEAFKLTLRTFSDRPELPPLATAIQAQLKAVGIDMAVSIGNSSEIPNGHQNGSLELALVARNYGLVPDPLGILLQDFGPRGGDWGAMGWHSDTVVQALQELTRTQTPPERTRALRHTITHTLQAELPVIPVAWYRQHVAVAPRLAGVTLDPLERSYRLTGMEWNNP
jgi:peptide/nickel transport system substrate-binding protein